MDDLIKTFKAQLYDRVSSPLFSSILIAWLSWNHRLIFALLSGGDAVKKFEFIDEKLYPTWVEVAGMGFGYPLLSALFLLYVFPYPSRWVYEHTRNEQKKLKEIQQRIDDETPLTQEEARALKVAIRKAEGDFERELDARNKLIIQLREEIKSLEAASGEPIETSLVQAKKAEDLDIVELDNRAIEVLHQVSTATNGVEKQSVLSARNERDRLLNQYAVDQLLGFEFIRVSPRGVYYSTPKGRAFLVQREMTPSIQGIG